MHKTTAIVRIALAALLVLIGSSALAEGAGQRVHRCIGDHGEIVFSGLACARPATPADGADTTGLPSMPADRCASSREALRARIADAIARRDPNALAGLAGWHGIGASAAAAHLRTLRDLVQRPLLAIDDDDDATGEIAGLRVRTGSAESGGVREYTFGVRVAGGCYWLSW